MTMWETMGKEEYKAFALKLLRPDDQLTIADLPEPEQIHPKRLLAELAEEFDRGIEV